MRFKRLTLLESVHKASHIFLLYTLLIFLISQQPLASLYCPVGAFKRLESDDRRRRPIRGQASLRLQSLRRRPDSVPLKDNHGDHDTVLEKRGCTAPGASMERPSRDFPMRALGGALTLGRVIIPGPFQQRLV